MGSNKQLLKQDDPIDTEAVLDKLVKLSMMGVPQRAIARAFGVDQSRISQIVNSDRFKERMGEMLAEVVEEQETLNRGWDSVEQIALSHVIEAMQTDPDPEFALRAAVMANRAKRRGGMSDSGPVLQHGIAGKAVINLQMNFANQLQTGNRDADPVVDSLPDFESVNDVMQVSDVEQLLTAGAASGHDGDTDNE